MDHHDNEGSYGDEDDEYDGSDVYYRSDEDEGSEEPRIESDAEGED